MRPSYESDEDRKRQQEVLDVLRNRFSNIVFHASKARYSPWDAMSFEVRNGSLIPRSIIEIKCRTTPFSAYPTYILSRRKLRTLWEFCKMFGSYHEWKRWKTKLFPIKPVLVVKFTDCLAYCDVRQEKSISWSERFGGRNDRQDSFDSETLFEIPKSEFIKL